MQHPATIAGSTPHTHSRCRALGSCQYLRVSVIGSFAHARNSQAQNGNMTTSVV
jgi:hypothetical protein